MCFTRALTPRIALLSHDLTDNGANTVWNWGLGGAQLVNALLVCVCFPASAKFACFLFTGRVDLAAFRVRRAIWFVLLERPKRKLGKRKRKKKKKHRSSENPAQKLSFHYDFTLTNSSFTILGWLDRCLFEGSGYQSPCWKGQSSVMYIVTLALTGHLTSIKIDRSGPILIFLECIYHD